MAANVWIIRFYRTVKEILEKLPASAYWHEQKFPKVLWLYLGYVWMAFNKVPVRHLEEMLMYGDAEEKNVRY